ncbi:MAG: hypothetical protein J7L44_02535 [Candidatus Diapherotrites archaeon]|nr:hypothetical protein [Candidatus Diapherotrites archaeon]
MDERPLNLIKNAKRKCLFCYARRTFELEHERKEVENTLKELIDYYESLYNRLRAKNASSEEISNALHNMRYCRETLEKCMQCDRTVDIVNRAFAYKI